MREMRADLMERMDEIDLGMETAGPALLSAKRNAIDHQQREKSLPDGIFDPPLGSECTYDGNRKDSKWGIVETQGDISCVICQVDTAPMVNGEEMTVRDAINSTEAAGAGMVSKLCLDLTNPRLNEAQETVMNLKLNGKIFTDLTNREGQLRRKPVPKNPAARNDSGHMIPAGLDAANALKDADKSDDLLLTSPCYRRQRAKDMMDAAQQIYISYNQLAQKCRSPHTAERLPSPMASEIGLREDRSFLPGWPPS